MGALDRLALGDLAAAVRRTVLVPNPAAGADFRIVVPGDQTWRVLAVQATLLTTAVVGARVPVLGVTDGNATVLRVSTAVTQPASNSTGYCWIPGVGTTTGAGFGVENIPLPLSLTLGAGQTLTCVTINLDVGDQWSAVTAWIEQQQTGVTDLAVARQAAEELYDEPL